MARKAPSRSARTSTKPKISKSARSTTTPAKTSATGAKSARTKEPPNPFGLKPRDLRVLREDLNGSNSYGAGKEAYEAATKPEAPPYEQFMLWLALQPGTRVALDWLEELEPLWTPEQAQGLLANLTLEPHEYEDGAYHHAPSVLVETLLRTEALDPTGLRAGLARRSWPSFVQPLLAFMAWTRGESIQPAEAMAMVSMLARSHVQGRRISTPGAYRGAIPFTCRDLGESLAGTEGWRQALLAADRHVGSHHLAHVREIFEVGSWIDLAGALVAYDRKPTSADEQAFVALLAQRQDTDNDLVTLAAALRGTSRSSVFAELAELEVANRRLARGASVKDLAMRLRFVTPLPFATESSRRVLAVLAEDERHAIMRADRERLNSGGRSVVGLADHFDPAVLDAYLELSHLDGPVVGVVGERALSAIEARLAAERHPTIKLRLGMALFFAIATAIDAGVEMTPSQLAFIARYPASHPRYADVIAALPLFARDDLYRLAARENAKGRELALVAANHPPSDEVLREVLAVLMEREPEIDWPWTVPTLVDFLPGTESQPSAEDSVAKLRAASAAIGGVRTTIYVFELPGEPAAPNELTRLGHLPQQGERHRHVLSIDLAQVPELTAWYPDAKVLELHTPRIQDNSRPSTAYADTQLIARKRPAHPVHGDRLVLHRVSVPSRLFSCHVRARDQALDKLAGLLVGHPGYVMGEAITIQGDGDDVGPGRFVMQLDDSFGINLGDAGRLYVFTGGATWDCA
jgi:hypothetical protein